MTDKQLDDILDRMAAAWLRGDAKTLKGGEKLIGFALKFGGLTQERLDARTREFYEACKDYSDFIAREWS